jgi:hypothetical protein
VLGGLLNLTNDARGVVQQTLEKIVHERAGGGDGAKLTNAVNIGIGTKLGPASNCHVSTMLIQL